MVSFPRLSQTLANFSNSLCICACAEHGSIITSPKISGIKNKNDCGQENRKTCLAIFTQHEHVRDGQNYGRIYCATTALKYAVTHAVNILHYHTNMLTTTFTHKVHNVLKEMK